MNTIITGNLESARRLPLSVNGNPRWEFVIDGKKYRTRVDANCAYKGEPRSPITIKLDGRGSVINYGWPTYPMSGV